MNEIKEIISQVKMKEKVGDKELKEYLSELDVNTLNKLLIIFSGPPRLTVTEVFKAAFIASAVIGMLLTYVILTPDYLVNTKANISIIVGVLCVVWLYYLRFVSNNENKLISLASKLVNRQKIVTLITYTLQEKYKNL
ncbi:hypothetical protein [Tuberibacillus calidus]|uniref:hypothetical protein n=1 Tax=Tuberibacillus calidus TaxID=340097 RepID=UPI00041D0472|nr:hypothetical protein [Tuberibacillus calidus]